MITIAWALLQKFWKPAAAVALVMAGLSCSYVKGRWDSTAAWKKKEAADKLVIAQAQLAEAKRRVKLQNEVDDLGEDLAKAQAQRVEVTRNIYVKVPQYVTQASEPCRADGLHSPGFRVLYDASVAGVDPGDPSPARLAAAAPVEAQAAAATIIDNNATANEWRSQVEGWQAWWAKVKNSIKVEP